MASEEMEKRGDGRSFGGGPDEGEGVRGPERRFEVGPTPTDVETGAPVLVPDAEAGTDFSTGEKVFLEDFCQAEPGGFERELIGGDLHESCRGGWETVWRFGNAGVGTFQWLPDMDSNHD